MSWTQQDYENLRKHWGNNTLVGWKLVYGEGDVIRSTDARFVDTPQRGVRGGLIKYYRRPKGGYSREVQNGLDFYILFSDQAESLAVPPEIKLGRNVTNEEFDRIIRWMRRDDEIVVGMSDEWQPTFKKSQPAI